MYDATEDGYWNVYVMNADGTGSKQMTHWKSVTARSTFSHDGRWIYFFSNTKGQEEIYRMPADGSGEPQQITHQGGTEPFESADGRYLYYTRNAFRGGSVQGIWRVPVGGGEEERVLSQGETSQWALAPDGIYYVNFGGPEWVIEFYSFATSKVRLVSRLPRDATLYRRAGPAFAISPDGKTILFVQVDHTESDVMLVENFR